MIEIFTCVAVIVSMFVLSPVLASLIAFNQAHRIIDFWTVIRLTKINFPVACLDRLAVQLPTEKYYTQPGPATCLIADCKTITWKRFQFSMKRKIFLE